MTEILCVKIASRGDLLLAAPAFRRLREARPEAQITLVVGASCQDVALRLPYFNHVEAIDDAALMGAGRWRRLAGAWQLLQRMRGRGFPGRRRRFAEALIFHRDWRYGLLARAAGIPVRRGLSGDGAERFLTHAYRAGEREHDTDQYLGITGVAEPAAAGEIGGAVDLAGVWRFVADEKQSALEVAAACGFRPAERPWVALAFGGGNNVKTRTTLKCWPLDRYRALAGELERRGYGVVWVGDGEDAAQLGDPAAGLVLAGRLTVPGTAAVLGACAAVVANDTLNLHLAEAQGTPTVAIFGPTNPEHYGPRGERSSYLWLGPERLACAPCHRGFFPTCTNEHRCMDGIRTEAVLERVLAALQGQEGGTDAKFLPVRRVAAR